MSEEIRLRREELLSGEVTRAVERERQLLGRRLPEPEAVSPLRRLLLSPSFHLPAAGILAALASWLLLEPHFRDMAHVGGTVALVNRDPFVTGADDAISLTVGSTELIVTPGETRLEPGADGQPPFSSLSDLEVGTVLEASGIADEGRQVIAAGLRPATPEHAAATGEDVDETVVAALLFFPLTAVLVALAVLLAEGIASRNWVRMAERMLVGIPLTLVFSALGMIPAGLAMALGGLAMDPAPGEIVTIHTIEPVPFLWFAACRSIAWACVGAATGIGMNIARSTKAQLRNSVVGGALGGALGGLFFDPIDRFFGSTSAFHQADLSRAIGLLAVGTSIGVFLALVERLAREAWLRVRTGPLAGKQFVIHRTPTSLGSAPQCDVYLFKDAEIGATHAVIHRVGNRYEIEDLNSRTGTQVAGSAIRRHRLVSGEAIVMGSTVLEFEERAPRA